MREREETNREREREREQGLTTLPWLTVRWGPHRPARKSGEERGGEGGVGGGCWKRNWR